jgi:hypothetical protein
MKFYRELCLEDFTTMSIRSFQLDIISTLFRGQIPPYKASNWGFSVFMGIFKFLIISYLLVYELNHKSELRNNVSLFSS